MRKKSIERELREILQTAKDDKLQIRIHQTLKQRYEKALMQQGSSMTDHLIEHILAFCIQVEAANRRKAQTENR